MAARAGRPDSWRFRRGPLLAAAARLAPPPDPAGLGLRVRACCPGCWPSSPPGRELWGNDGRRGARGQGPAGLRRSAAQCWASPIPRSRLARPPSRDGLAVQACRRRGRRPCPPAPSRDRRAGRGWYWQRRARGRAGLRAHGRQWPDARVLGSASSRGAAAGPAVPVRRRARAGITSRRSPRAGLARGRGCAGRALRAARAGQRRSRWSHGDEITVLELNPRPGALARRLSPRAGLSTCSPACRGLSRRSAAWAVTADAVPPAR